MILENGQPSYEEALAHFKWMLEVFQHGDDVLQGSFPTDLGFSTGLDDALWKIAGARIDSHPLQPLIDNAWKVFHELFPIEI